MQVMARHRQRFRWLRFRLRTCLLVMAVLCGVCHLLAEYSRGTFHQRVPEWTFKESTTGGIRTLQPSLQTADHIYWSRLISNVSLSLAVVLLTVCVFAWDKRPSRDTLEGD